MALPRPTSVGLIHVQDVQVNGLNYHNYRHLHHRIREGDLMDLRAQPDNIHDDNAVEVRVAGGEQVGWVPRAVNQHIAQLLDEGHTLVAQVIRHRHNDLQIRVSREDKSLLVKPPDTAAKPPDPVATVKVGGRCTNNPDGLAKLMQDPAGTMYEAISSSGRTSVTLVSWSGEDLAYFRKQLMPPEAQNWADHGDLAAIKRQDGQFDLYYANRTLNEQQVKERYGGILLAKGGVYGPDGKLIGYQSGTLATPWVDSSEYPAAPGLDFGFGPDAPGLTIRPDGSFTARNASIVSTSIKPTTNKENTMNNFFARLIDTNKKAATDAAVLEAGRIANNTVVKLLISRMPFLARFTGAKYFQGPVGKLVVANGALVLAQQLRPNDPRVRSLTEAMAVQAYQEVYQEVDIEGMIDQLLDLPEIKRAMKKLEPQVGEAAVGDIRDR